MKTNKQKTQKSKTQKQENSPLKKWSKTGKQNKPYTVNAQKIIYPLRYNKNPPHIKWQLSFSTVLLWNLLAMCQSAGKLLVSAFLFFFVTVFKEVKPITLNTALFQLCLQGFQLFGSTIRNVSYLPVIKVNYFWCMLISKIFYWRTYKYIFRASYKLADLLWQ